MEQVKPDGVTTETAEQVRPDGITTQSMGKKMFPGSNINQFYIKSLTIDDDASTRAILQHSYAELIEAGLLDEWPLTPKGKKKTDSGKLILDHPTITFLSDLCHRIRSFGKYLYAEERKTKAESQMTKVDCLRLKRNFAWWLFTCQTDSLDEMRKSGYAVVYHHFNNHSHCGVWCPHKDKPKEDLDKLLRYRNVTSDKKLFDQSVMILEIFLTDNKLRECMHKTHSQKNEAMHKSYDRYAPKKKTFSQWVALNGRIAIAVGIEKLGYLFFCDHLFLELGLEMMDVTKDGLRSMSLAKECEKSYQRRDNVKRRQNGGNIKK